MEVRSSKKSGQKFLKGLLTYRADRADTTRSIELFLHSLDCPRSLAVWLMFVNNEHEQLAKLEFDPSITQVHVMAEMLTLRPVFCQSTTIFRCPTTGRT